MGEIKEAYIAELKKRLGVLAVKMNSLQHKMDTSDLDQNHALFQEMAALRLKIDETNNKLQAMIESNNPEWGHLKQELEIAWDFLHGGLEKMADALKRQWD